MQQMIQHLGAQMAAVNRIGLAQVAMMRQAFTATHIDVMTPTEYFVFVAWPGDEAHTSGGGGTSSGAQAMEEDGTEEEDSDAGTKIAEDGDFDAKEDIVETEVEEDDDDEEDEEDD
ncbi:hypothetical protein V8G54_007436 [Vigna mungo]|uniref:Uncharacterized protein n=1 Tax=Vigna mungo TaxID=3915 RepID=A0AAQ3P1M5_VIGMU